MSSRRRLLGTIVGGASVGLAGCQSLPFGGCSRTDATPPAGTSFSLTWGTDDGDDVLYLRYDDGPVIDGSNTGYLESRIHVEGAGDVVAPWYDHTESTAREDEPASFGRQPVTPGDERLIGRLRPAEEWRFMRLYWAPPSVDDRPRPCEMAILREWTERPQPP